MELLFILIYQIGCDKIEYAILTEEESTCASYGKGVYKIVRIFESSKSR